VVERVAHLLKDRDIDVWFDEWRLRAGGSLIRGIQDGIRDADFVVVFFSEHALSSPWVQEEYEAGKVRQIETREQVIVIPARLDDCELPEFMKARVYADFRQSFVLGFTAVVEAILPADGIRDIDRTFAKYSRLMAAGTMGHVSADYAIAAIGKSSTDRWLGASLSATTLSAQARSVTRDRKPDAKRLSSDSVDLARFEKWLGNTTRDYLQFKVYQHAYEYLQREPASPGSESGRLLDLADRLFAELNDCMREFGNSSSRRADSTVAQDVEKLFSLFLSSGEGGLTRASS